MFACRLCGNEKGVDEFYKNPSSKSGYDSKCKECAKSMMKLARERNKEHYKEFDRKRAMRPDRVAARSAYQKTESGKLALRRARDKYKLSAPLRRSAHVALGNAIRDGRIDKWPVCAIHDCSCNKVEAHHPDYSRPLDVVWLCNKHHREVHEMVKFL